MRKKLLVFSLLAIMIVLGCNSKSEKVKTPDELKLELSSAEGNDPIQYLILDSIKMSKNEVRKGNLFRSPKYDGYKITGVVKNSATLAKFKDVIITVQILSKTQSIISEQDFTLYEIYEPNAKKLFNLIINPSSAMNSYNVYLKGASYIE